MLAKFLKSSVVFGALSLAACGGVCGDGVIDAENKDGLAEVCDDGNSAPGDGCNATCSLVENGFECPTAGEACTEIPAEVCSGGVDEDQDGLIDCLDPNCFDDAACVTCGDGILAVGEQCDDQNTDAGDGCDATCQAEANSTYTFNGTDNDGTTDDGTLPKFAAFEFVQFGDSASGFVVITSDNPNICNDLALAGGINDFQNSLFDANGLSIGSGNDQVVATIALTNNCSNDATIPCTVATQDADCGVGNTCDTAAPAIGVPVVGLGNDGVSFVDNFFCNADGTFCVQSDFQNSFTLTDIVIGADTTLPGANISFTIDAGSNMTSDVSPAVAVDLTTPFPVTATVNAFQCPNFF